MKKLSNLQELLQYQLQLIFDAENQLIKALPIFAESTTNSELKKIFSLHLTETKMHKERISGMAQDLNLDLKGKSCRAMQKLIRKTKKFCTSADPQATKDTGLLIYTQQIEHYEIASYTNLVHYAQLLNYNYLTNFLQQNQIEETNTYNKLKALSAKGINNHTRNYFAA